MDTIHANLHIKKVRAGKFIFRSLLLDTIAHRHANLNFNKTKSKYIRVLTNIKLPHGGGTTEFIGEKKGCKPKIAQFGRHMAERNAESKEGAHCWGRPQKEEEGGTLR